MSLPVAIVGGGGFGQALSRAAARVGRRVILVSRQDREVDHERTEVTADLGEAARAEIVFMAVPSPHMEVVAADLGRHLDGSHLVVHVSRGLVGDDLRTLTRVIRTQTPARRVGVLAGPLVARSLTEGQPGGGLVGTLFPEVADAVRDAIGGPTLRIYGTDDVVGAEVGSAFVGLIAVALGYARETGFGPGTLAVLATRGIAEATRIGVHLGAQERTFSGLSGYGDLIAAVAGDGRPELQLGKALAEGVPLKEAAARTGAYVEGVQFAAQVTAYAKNNTLSAPLAEAMASLLSGADPKQVVTELMTRPMGRE